MYSIYQDSFGGGSWENSCPLGRSQNFTDPLGLTKPPSPTTQVKEKKPHVKKPLNAFMLFMKEKRADVIKECTLKESAAINQILGKMVREKGGRGGREEVVPYPDVHAPHAKKCPVEFEEQVIEIITSLNY